MHAMITVNAAWNVWNFRRAIVAALIDQGWQVSVLAPHDGSVSRLESLGCRFIPLEMSLKGLNPIESVSLTRRFERIFRNEAPDVILSYTIKNNIFGAAAARMCGRPFLPNVTGLGTAFLSGGALQLVAETLYRHAFSRLPVVFMQNEDDRDHFLSRRLVRGEQVRLLPGSGIDLGAFEAVDLPSAETPPTFLMIARLLRDKGVIEYIEAARLLQCRYPGARFRLLGSADYENRSAIPVETIRSVVDEGVIDWLGTSDDVRPHIAEAHCVVLPSYREGAPRTLIEAAAMARPLIATDVPGCRSVVDDGSSGFLCKARDADSLSAALAQFIDLPHDSKADMGKAGRVKMEKGFDVRIVVKAYLDAIAEIANRC